MDYKYFVFNKPFGVISQFSKTDNKSTLADFLNIEKSVYPIGRLDTDSEGLLLLSNDPELNSLLLQPTNNYSKKYLVQVDHEITPEAIKTLSNGVCINVDGKQYTTKPCIVKRVNAPAFLWERNPPIRFRKSIPTSWIEIVLTEGKNRQIRKMTAKVGFPTLRLIRTQIGGITIGQLKPGDYKLINRNELFSTKSQ